MIPLRDGLAHPSAAPREPFLEPVPRADLLLVLALSVVGALLLLFSAPYQQMHDADSILPAIMAHERITFYWWGQNRLANLLPALTVWVKPIDVNLAVQVFLRALLGFLSLACLLAILAPRTGFAAPFAVAVVFALLSHDESAVYYYFLHGQPYGMAIVALVAAAACLDAAARRRRPLPWALLVALAAAVATVGLALNPAAVFFMPVVFLCRGAWRLLHRRSPASDLAFVGVVAGAFVVMYVHARVYGANHPATFVARYDGFDFGFGALIEGLRSGLALTDPLLLAVKLALISLLLVGWPFVSAGGADDRAALRGAGLALLAGTMTQWVVFSQSGWVQVNGQHLRYYVSNLFAIDVLAAGAATALLGAALERARPLPFGVWRRLSGRAAATAVAAAAVFLAVRPLAAPLALNEHHELTAEFARRAVAIHADFVVGDFWYVWPTVFEAIRLRQRRSLPKEAEPLGIAVRAEAIADVIAGRGRRAMSEQAPLWALCVRQHVDRCVDRLTSFVGPFAVGAAGECGDGCVVLALRPPPSYVLGETITFREGGNAFAFVAEGLLHDEPGGGWTRGSRVRLVLPLDRRPVNGDLRLVAEASAQIRPQHPQLEVDVAVNGETIARWGFTFGRLPQAQSARVPAELVDPSSPVEIEFRLLDPVSSAELRAPPDTPRPRLRLRTLRLEEVDEEPAGR